VITAEHGREEPLYRSEKTRKRILTIALVSIVLTLNQTAFSARAHVLSEAHTANAMSIEPSYVNLSTDTHDIGYKFNVTIWVNITSVPSSIQVVTAWQLVISYDKSQLNATRCGYTAGAKSQFFSNITAIPLEPQFGSLNATHNFVMHGENWVSGPKRTIPGTGSLSWVEFEIVAKPLEGQAYSSMISLVTTGARVCKILDDTLDKVSFTSYDCTYKYGIYDIEITNVIPTKPIVGQGYDLTIEVIVENHGSFIESFNVSLYCNDTVITLPNGENCKTVTLVNGSSTAIGLSWNTTSYPKGNYTMRSYVPPIPYERNTTNNNYTDGMVRVGIPGDVDPIDGYVGIDDIFNIASHFGQEPGHPNWNAVYDVNNDNYIGIDDIFIAASHFGEQEDP
jgi:hypothetical protein